MMVFLLLAPGMLYAITSREVSTEVTFVAVTEGVCTVLGVVFCHSRSFSGISLQLLVLQLVPGLSLLGIDL